MEQLKVNGKHSAVSRELLAHAARTAVSHSRSVAKANATGMAYIIQKHN
ncbi:MULTISPECIES: hypothetical protein [Moorena]|nr:MULTISPECIES: hypothetical protein [Moorena]NEP35126.1 hypothetical protein [Moorena sp. SIO3B2]NEP69675.1 hypothetical protein [Moorena sp. SIO3A5]NEQ08466.1 hypothetical protein [Moorena sp. SIO4E2]NER86027.1 hypothetical protein [Moorena sp. SIO3A2]NES42180.1 hypothetical protein [Moorena sp. SIO2C4]